MKRLKLALGIVLASAAALSAQEVVTPQYEVDLNYSWLHVSSAPGHDDLQRTANGGSGSFEYNFSKVAGIVADFGGYANTRINDRAFTYMFGPRFNWRHARLTPYVQVLAGGVYVWNDLASQHSVGQNSFAFAAGGGLEYHLTKLISIKPIQVEYIMTQISSTKGFGSYQNDIRYSGGASFRFGAK